METQFASARSDNFTNGQPIAEFLLHKIFAFYGVLNKQGSLVELKGKIFERTNLNPSLLIGQKFSETVFWQSSEFTPKTLEAAIADAANGLTTKSLLDFRLSFEEKLFVELNLNPSNDRAVDEIYFHAYDVTNQERQIEYHRQRSEQLLFAAESAEIGLWSWNLQDNTVYSTPKCNEIFEIPPFQEIQYDNFIEIIHPDDRVRIEAILESSQTKGTEYDEKFRVVYADGTIEWISASGKTFLDETGTPLKMMGVVCNISKQKQFEEDLERVYDRERKARDEAEDANRSKDFFLAFVSHELRSPLNAILGWSKILLSKKVDEETQKNALETIERSARSQSKLINDLVDSARIASGKLRLEFQPLNLYQTLKSVYHSQKPLTDAKNITLTLDAQSEEVPVIGDVTRLQQIFNNLISNSIKFTPSGGSISINLTNTSNMTKVVIKDNGQGINPDSLPFIFRQFSQANDNQSVNKQGLGLGLSIVKVLVEKHNGAVRAESAGIGLGSSFTVSLPIAVGETLQTAAKPAQFDAKPLENITILLVEDDADSREVMQLFLEQCGAQVIGAESAAAAVNLLSALENNLPDIIVSDLAMPGEDGYSLISRLRQSSEKQGGQIPAIALSAFTTGENKRKALECGFQKYTTKPFDPDLLIKEILDLVRPNSQTDK